MAGAPPAALQVMVDSERASCEALRRSILQVGVLILIVCCAATA